MNNAANMVADLAVTPTPEDVARLEDAVRRFNDHALAGWRLGARLILVFGGVLAAVLAALAGLPKLGFGLLFLGVEAALVAFVAAGLYRPTALFSKVKEYILGWRWQSWAMLALSGTLFIIAVWLLGLMWLWVLVTLMALVIGGAIHFTLDRTVERQRRPAVDAVEELLNGMRLRGLSEERVREFVCKYAGIRWEELYEELFGYAEKLKAREWWRREQDGPARPRFGAWREPLIDALNRRLLARQLERERRENQKLAAELKLAGDLTPVATPPAAAASAPQAATFAVAPEEPGLRRPRAIAPVVLQEPPAPTPRRAPPSLGRLVHGALMLVMGPTVRVLIGLALLSGWGLWMWQNGLFDKVRDIREAPDALKLLRADEAVVLHFPNVPTEVTRWFNGFGAAVGGLIMLLSAFLPNWKAALLMPAAAVVAWLGPHLGIPAVESWTAAQVSLAAGGVLGLLGVLVGQRP